MHVMHIFGGFVINTTAYHWDDIASLHLLLDYALYLNRLGRFVQRYCKSHLNGDKSPNLVTLSCKS